MSQLSSLGIEEEEEEEEEEEKETPQRDREGQGPKTQGLAENEVTLTASNIHKKAVLFKLFRRCQNFFLPFNTPWENLDFVPTTTIGFGGGGEGEGEEELSSS